MNCPDIEPRLLEEWQEITNLIASLCHVPAALVMRQNQHTMEVMASSQNSDSPYNAFETAPLNGDLYCETVIKAQSPLHVPNALNDPDWDHNPDIELGMISYYGVPVNWPDGSPFGTICIVDRVEKSATDEEKEIVKRFARIIEMTLELIVSNYELERSRKRYLNLYEHSHDVLFIFDPAKGEIVDVNPKVKKVLGYRPDELIGRPMIDLHPDEVPELMAFFSDVMQKGEGRTDTLTCLAKSGEKRFADISAFLIEEDGKELAVATVRDITKRKQAEKDIRESEEKYHSLMRNAQDAIFVADGESGMLIDANRKAEELIGLPRENIIGMHQAQLHPEADIERYMKLFQHALESDGGMVTEPVYVQHHDGSKIPVEINAGVVEVGGKKFVQGIFRNISKRKHTQETLLENERLLNEAQTIAKIGHWKLDVQTNEIFGSKELFKIFGMERSKNTLDAFASVVHPDDREFDLMHIQRGIEYGEDWDIEHRLLLKDGRIKHVHAIGHAIADDNGRTLKLIGTIQDISKRKQVEEMLLESKARSEILFNAITDAVFVHEFRLDGSIGKFIEVNDVACRHLGYTREELLDLSPLDIDAPDSGVNLEPLVRCLVVGESVSFEQTHISKDGKRIPVEIHAQLFSLKGNPAVMSLVRDISENKQAKEALRKSEAKYRQLIEGLEAEYFFYTHGVDGVFTYISPSVQNVLGYQAEEYLIHYNNTLTDNPINQMAREKSEASIQGKRQSTYEVEVHRKDNSICRLAVTEAPVFNEAGEVVAVEGIAHDITKRKQVEEALELSQARHKEAQRIAHLGHWTFDLKANEATGSDENCRIFGVELGTKISYEGFFEIVHPDDVEFVQRAYTGHVENKDPFNVEHRLLFPDGSIKWVHERCETEYADDGSALRSMGTTLDITERRLLKDTLYFTAQRGWDVDGEDFFQALASHLAKSLQIDFVIIGKLLNPKRVKTVALCAKGKTGNNIEYSLSGTPCEKVVGNDLCYYPQGIQQLFPFDEMLVKTGAESYLGIPLRDSKGEALGLIALIDSKPMINESRARSLLQIVAVRVAAELERKSLDKALEQSREQLRALIEHIQAVREEEQKRIARDVHDVLGQLLTAININISWIEEMLAEEQQDILVKAQDTSAFVSTAIRKVQQISSTLRPTLLDDLGITAAIEWQVNEFQNRTGIRCIFAFTLGEMNIANNLATEIYRIFQEALTNVARHAEATEVTVNLTKNDGSVILDVRDNGRGITEEEINNSRSFGLLGIRERAYSLQGNVVIHGKPGKGSSIIATFPTGGKR